MTGAFVLDASVGVKVVLPEDHSERVADLLAGGRRLLVPDLFFLEAGNVFWKRVQRGEMTEAQAVESQRLMLGLPLEVVPGCLLVLEALSLACQTRATVYDCLYLALAIREAAPLVTADGKLLRLLSPDHPATASVRSIQDVLP